MRSLEQMQHQLDIEGFHPGPLFGPLPIRRQTSKPLRSKLYRLQLRRATPPWVDRQAIKSLYKEAKRVTKLTGVLHTADHVIPLRGLLVCGLHVHTNMQVITQQENMQKGNFFVDQPRLF